MRLSHAAQYLKASLMGDDHPYEGVSIDTRTLKPGELFIAFKGPQFDGHDFIEQAIAKKAAGVVVSRAISTRVPTLRVNNTHEALKTLARVAREQYAIPVIAITGSCGKTTTRALADSIFSQAGETLASQGSFNNDIGVPLTVLKLRDAHRFLVQEMGANHAGELRELTHLVKPDVAIITCAAPVHLEGFGSVEGVAKAKGEIFEGLRKEGTAIINADDEYFDYWKKLNAHRRFLTFGFHPSADVRASDLERQEDGTIVFQLHAVGKTARLHLPLIGEHNVMNALAASAAAIALHLPLDTIKAGLENAKAVERRSVIKKGIQGAKIIDDSYNANPKAFSAALQVLKLRVGKKILVIGDMAELGPAARDFHHALGLEAREQGVHALFCFGPLSKACALSFGEKGFHFDDKNKLVDALRKILDENTTVLVKGSNSMGMDEVVAKLVTQNS